MYDHHVAYHSQLVKTSTSAVLAPIYESSTNVTDEGATASQFKKFSREESITSHMSMAATVRSTLKTGIVDGIKQLTSTTRSSELNIPLRTPSELLRDFKSIIHTFLLRDSPKELNLKSTDLKIFLAPENAGKYLPLEVLTKTATATSETKKKDNDTDDNNMKTVIPIIDDDISLNLGPPSPALFDSLVNHIKKDCLLQHYKAFLKESTKNASNKKARYFLGHGVGGIFVAIAVLLGCVLWDPRPSKWWRLFMAPFISASVIGM